MQQAIKGAHMLFRKENPDIVMGYTLFSKLRPKNVRKMSANLADSCHCVYCLNVRHKVQALNRASTASKLDSNMKLTDEVAIYNLLLCKKGDYEKFHKVDCIGGTCAECGDRKKTLLEHYQPLLEINPMIVFTTWRRRTEDKKTSREPLIKRATARELLLELEEDLLTPAQNTTFGSSHSTKC